MDLFYLAIVIFIWLSAVYLTANYFKKLIKAEDSAGAEQQISNEQE